MTFTRITTEAALPPIDEAAEFICGGRAICIANVNGTYSAMDGICPHRGGPLGQGMIEGCKVVCPWHAWAWDAQTGATELDSKLKVQIYPMKIENGDVIAEI
ncbi:MAG TPA: Rieske 2Fe-2S domain-containing protein [Candidatus Sulfotelmatobacter sp.]|jgi:nitrite reductase (NADH) small subunit